MRAIFPLEKYAKDSVIVSRNVFIKKARGVSIPARCLHLRKLQNYGLVASRFVRYSRRDFRHTVTCVPFHTTRFGSAKVVEIRPRVSFQLPLLN